MTKPVLFRVTNKLDVGGISNRLRQVLPLLREEYDVHVVTYAKREGELAQEMRDKGISVHNVPLQGKWSPAGLCALAGILRKYKADIVHTHSFGGNISGILAAAMARIPLRMGQVHSRQHWYGKTELRRKKQIMEEYAVHSLCSHAVLFPSQTALRHFASHCPVARRKLHVLYNGIDLSGVTGGTPPGADWLQNPQPNLVRERLRAELAMGSESKILGFVGRLTGGKGVEFALRFMQQLANDADCRMVFVGPFSDKGSEDAVRREAAALGTGRVYFAGLQQDPHPWYRAFDALFFPSDPWTEALPGAILEGAAHGLPILSRENEAVREIAGFYNGIHFMHDNDNPKDALAALFAMPPADPARMRETFSIEAMAKNTSTLYRELWAKAHPGRPLG